MSAILIKNARYLGAPTDLLVRNGEIAAMGSLLSDAEAAVVDAGGKILFPSFIDAHVHLRDPGFEWKENVSSGLEAAAHGGFGAVMCMANTDPVNDEAAVTRLILEKAAKAWPHGPRVYPIGAATMGLNGTHLTPVAELAEAGCVALSNDGKPFENTEILRRVMEYGSDFNLTLIDHCEDPWLAKKSHMNESTLSGLMGLKGQPDVGEAIQALRDIMLAEYLKLPVHIAHVSAACTVDAIAWGKSRGVKVTAETCPHYLLLDENAVRGYNTLAKVNPPLRTQADIDSLRKAVKSGLIDILATDHAPHAHHEKYCPFDQAPNGYTGLDLAVTLSYSLVRQNLLSEADMIRLWCEKPAAIFNLPINRFKQGDPANFFLFDPQKTWVVTPETLHSKSANTPWLNQEVHGRVSDHWIGGVKIV